MPYRIPSTKFFCYYITSELWPWPRDLIDGSVFACFFLFLFILLSDQSLQVMRISRLFRSLPSYLLYVFHLNLNLNGSCCSNFTCKFFLEKIELQPLLYFSFACQIKIMLADLSFFRQLAIYFIGLCDFVSRFIILLHCMNGHIDANFKQVH